MSLLIIKSLWFLLPAGLANIGASWGRFIPLLNTPVDFNKTLGKRPVFGPNKTYRGLIIAAIIGVLVFLLQKQLYNYQFFKNISLFNYNELSLWIGFSLGFGAIIGDLIESFFKRRFSKAPGQLWLPWDQTDCILGAIIFTLPFLSIPFNSILIMVIFGFIIHIIFKIIGYWIGIERNWI